MVQCKDIEEIQEDSDEVIDDQSIVCNCQVVPAEIDPINDFYNTVGFETRLLMNNLGSLFVICCVILLLYPIYFLLGFCDGVKCCRKNRRRLR